MLLKEHNQMAITEAAQLRKGGKADYEYISAVRNRTKEYSYDAPLA